MSAFEELNDAGYSALDLALVDTFARLWPQSDPRALTLAALTSWAVGRGHSCFTPELLAEWTARGASTAPEQRTMALTEALRAGPFPASDFIGDGQSGLPIVVDGQRAWLRRYWRYEREIEADLRARAEPFATMPDQRAVTAALDRLLPVSESAETDWQRVAAVIALRARLTVICGGPGTGKTYTALRMLALIQQFADRRLRIGLAAPTGKAAQRLSESVRLGLQELNLSDAERADLPADASTLHRLLGFRPQSVQPSRDASRPLDLDVLVVDECSMVDLPLMAKLLRALKPDCRLILLGDPDQLPAVENGAVLATLAAGNPANRFSANTADWIAQTSAAHVEARADVSPVAECIVRLERPRRFGGDSGIARLVRAIRSGATDQVFEVLAASTDIAWSEIPWRIDHARSGRALRESWRVLTAAGTAAAALQALTTYRILCALREGPHGVAGLNHEVSVALHGAQAGDTDLAGRPILITSNHHALDLFNGDVGVMFSEPPGAAPRAWFARGDGGERALLPAQLPAHESAYAMTVHKAQGSEFDTVELVLPAEPHPLLTREWLYTAVSRARHHLRLHASRPVLAAALARTTRRMNGISLFD